MWQIVCAYSPWFFPFFFIFLLSHLVNLTFVHLTDPSFIPQLQFICCCSTSFNSLFLLSLSSSFSLFTLYFHYLIPTEDAQAQYSRVLAKHLTSTPLTGQHVCSNKVLAQSVHCLLELSNTPFEAIGKFKRCCSMKELISVNSFS